MTYKLFDIKFLYDKWGHELDGQAAFYSNSIDNLIEGVEDFNKDMRHRITFCSAEGFKYAYFDPNYECKVAFNRGRQIQVYNKTNHKWKNIENPMWLPDHTYRINLEQYYVFYNANTDQYDIISGLEPNPPDAELVYTGKHVSCKDYIEQKQNLFYVHHIGNEYYIDSDSSRSSIVFTGISKKECDDWVDGNAHWVMKKPCGEYVITGNMQPVDTSWKVVYSGSEEDCKRWINCINISRSVNKKGFDEWANCNCELDRIILESIKPLLKKAYNEGFSKGRKINKDSMRMKELMGRAYEQLCKYYKDEKPDWMKDMKRFIDVKSFSKPETPKKQRGEDYV